MYTKNLNSECWLEDCINLVKTAGFCILENVIRPEGCLNGIHALDETYGYIKEEISPQRLMNAGEEGVLRAPMKFSSYFMQLLENTNLQKIVDNILSDTSILHLQNGFIFPSQKNDNLKNFQYTYHADFPRYLNDYVASLNILVTFTEITETDNIFYVVPGSHQQSQKFSEEFCRRNSLSIAAKAGSVLIFDSTLWHCGGPNYSGSNWYGVNHQYTKSFIKQQMDYVRLLGEDLVLEQQARVQQLLGYYTRVVTSLDEYYQPEEKRLYRKGQG